MSQIFPEVLDKSTLTAIPTSPIYLPIGIEGQMDNDGSAVVGTLYRIQSVSDAITYFGVASRLTTLLIEILKRGSSPVIAGASKKGSAPLLADRQVVWDSLSSDPNVRIRLTGSTVQAELAALATSCVQAELAQHKQFMIGGMPSATTKANHIAAAGAIASKRGVLISPGVYDENGALQDGAFASACAAAVVSKNSDPSNDLDLEPIPFLTGIELDGLGYALFREKVAAGALVNDFEDLLQGGVSPLMPSDSPGGVQTTHLRMTYTTDRSFDALSTRIIDDQVFLDVKSYVMAMGYLRRPNNDDTRAQIASGVEALLMQRQDWISPVVQVDGTLGFQVSAVASSDQTQVIVGYKGQIERGIQTIAVAAQLTIPV